MEGRSRSAAMPVAERFVSINGEGPRAGRFAAFVRFAGCNLSCSYCDTRWACQPGCPVEQLSCAQIARWVLEQGVPCATLTGGEPLLQPLLPELARILLEQGSCTVEVETNGACSVEPLCALRAAHPGRLAITLDCKLPSSGMAQHMLEGNYALLGEADCVKFVAGSEEDLVEAARVMREHGLLQRCPVYVSPVFLCSGGVDSSTLLAMAVERYGAHKVVALSISYGQKHIREIESARAVAAHYGVEQRFLDLGAIFADSSCSLLAHSGEEIPRESYADQLDEAGGQPVSTYVPFRNGLFLSSAASMALGLGCGVL